MHNVTEDGRICRPSGIKSGEVQTNTSLAAREDLETGNKALQRVVFM
jgi:hypothetical protein